MTNTLELARQCGIEEEDSFESGSKWCVGDAELQSFRDACVKEATEELQSRIAMQGEAMRELDNLARLRIPDYEEYRVSDDVRDAISATSEDVAAWQEKQLAPLRREVAMLHLSAEDRGLVINGLILERERSLQRKKVNSESCSDLMADDCARLIKHFTDLNDTQATAEAYEKEVAAKAKLELADMIERELQLYAGQDIADRIRYDVAAELRGEKI